MTDRDRQLLLQAREALTRAADSLADAQLAFRLFGKEISAEAMGIATRATRNEVALLDAEIARLRGGAAISAATPRSAE